MSPSEDAGKVVGALRNVTGEGSLGDVRFIPDAVLVTDDPRALAHVRDQLRDRHVRAAARRQLLLNMVDDSTSVMLNRQAAAVGVVAICGTPDESPLGPIYLKIESVTLVDVVDWLTGYSG